MSWSDAHKYYEWLSKKKGIKFQLPTEAQWEKGARGTDERKYPWGNHDLYYDGKYYVNYAATYDGFYFTAPVGSYPQGASPYGLLDMAGNVEEWVNDWYGYHYYESSLSENPTGPVSGTFRVIRDGSWFDYGGNIRSFNRIVGFPYESFNWSGFRLAQ